MILTKTLIAILISLGGDQAVAAPVVLQAGPLAAGFSAEDGALRSLAVRGHELLAGPGQLLVAVDGNEPVSLHAVAGVAVSRPEGGLVIEGREPRSGVAVRAEWIAGKDLECRLTLAGGDPNRQEAAVELRLPCVKQEMQLLAPCGNDRTVVDFSRASAVGYRGDAPGMVMPAAVLYRPEDDWGLTAMADFTLPTRGFELRIDHEPPAVAVRRVHLRLEQGKPVTVSIILSGHEGDWRPGLGRVVERYPEFFVVADQRVPQLHGAFVCSGGTPQDDAIASWKRQHVQTVEVHGTIPFYGQHLPLGDSWPIFADDQWHRLREKPDPDKPADDAPWKAIHEYVGRKSPGRITVGNVNDYIRRLHAQGIFALMYFNPTESWKPWITENYPEALYRTAEGKPVPVWYESYLVCPDPESRWGKHLLDEFAKMMELYPEADGFFMDQSTYDSFDYGHDDGWSIQNGRTGYRMGWAIDQISQRCRAMAKARGKFLWWNGPYYSDIAYYAEGMMAEAGDEGQVRAIHYLTMGGRACCTLSTRGELVFQNCAAYGLYPTAMGDPTLLRLAERYWPIFDLFRGKRWVLEAHALRLPEGTKGNIFRLPDGNVLVTVVSGDRAVDGETFDLDLPLDVRLSDAAEFRAAYYLSPDLLGKRRLSLDRKNQAIKIVLPRHQSASAVLLAKTGAHAAIDGPWEVTPGQKAEAALVIDNWTSKAVAGTVKLPGEEEKPVSVTAGASVRRAFTVTAPAEKKSLREAIAVGAALDGCPCGGEFEFRLALPLEMTLQTPEGDLCQDRPAVVRVDVLNFAAPRDVEVTLSGEGLAVSPPKQTSHLAARAKGPLEFRVTAARPGRISLKASAAAGGQACHAERERELEVLATKASPALLKQIRSGTLLLGLFGSDGGKYADKPVLLNGVRIGVLPPQGDHWGRAEMPLTPDALAALREDNEVRIENRVADAFKVRNLQLRLKGPIGVVSELNAETFTSCGWEYAEGKVFRLGEALSGIRVRIPSAGE